MNVVQMSACMSLSLVLVLPFVVNIVAKTIRSPLDLFFIWEKSHHVCSQLAMETIVFSISGWIETMTQSLPGSYLINSASFLSIARFDRSKSWSFLSILTIYSISHLSNVFNEACHKVLEMMCSDSKRLCQYISLKLCNDRTVL